MKQAFSKEQLEWFTNNPQLAADTKKFKGVSHKDGEFIYTDRKGIKKKIIPKEDQEQFIITTYTDQIL